MARFRVENRWAFGFPAVLTFSPMTYGPPMAALPGMLEDDRRRAGWSVEQAARRLGVSVRTYRELEVGERSPNVETFSR